MTKKKYFVGVFILILFPRVLWGESVELLKKALYYAKQNEHEKAISIYEKVLREDPKNILGLQGAGLSYLSLGHYEKGLPYLKKAFTIERRNLTTLFALART